MLGRFDMVQEALVDDRDVDVQEPVAPDSGAVHRVVVPVVKETVPIGVPDPDAEITMAL